MISRLRFLILQVILISLLTTLWFNGTLAPVMAGESHYWVIGVVAVASTGLAAIFMGNRDYAEWLCTNLLIVGVAGMQIGLAVAMGALVTSLGGGDSTRIIGTFIGSVGTALYVSIAALLSLLWLRINLRFAQ